MLYLGSYQISMPGEYNTLVVSGSSHNAVATLITPYRIGAMLGGDRGCRISNFCSRDSLAVSVKMK
jgi:hypothetical protein